MAEYDDDPRASFHKIMRRFREAFSGSFVCREMMPGVSTETWEPPTDI